MCCSRVDSFFHHHCSSVRFHLSTYQSFQIFIRQFRLKEPIQRIPQISTQWPGRFRCRSQGYTLPHVMQPVSTPRQPFFGRSASPWLGRCLDHFSHQPSQNKHCACVPSHMLVFIECNYKHNRVRGVLCTTAICIFLQRRLSVSSACKQGYFSYEPKDDKRFSSAANRCKPLCKLDPALPNMSESDRFVVSSPVCR